MNFRGSRSRSPHGGRRGGFGGGGGGRRSPVQERGAYQRRSNSRSLSRGKRDAGKQRRSRFSDQNGGGHEGAGGFSGGGGFGGFSSGGVGIGGGGGGFSSGFADGGASSNFNYTNVRNHQTIPQEYDDSIMQIRMPDQSDQQQGNFSAVFHTNQPLGAGSTSNGSGMISIANGDLDPGYITINTNALRVASKISRKVYIPQDNKFNYIGLIIGPKGANQKQLEEDTNCKILIRGRGSQKSGLTTGAPDENEDLHVLIEADSEANAVKAMREIENIIFMDEDEKAKKRDAQLRSAHAQGIGSGRMNEFTADPEKLNFIVVPNNCVGLVIGRKGDMIKQIRERSGADKVYMQSEANRNLDDDFQNLIVEGTSESIEQVRSIIDEIIQQQRRKLGGGSSHSGPRIEMEIPATMAGLVIGKQGSTLAQVGQQTRTHCSIQQNSNPDQDGKKFLIITGATDEECQQAKLIFEEKMNARINAIQNANAPRQFGPGSGGYGMPPFGGGGRGGGGYPPRGGGRPPFRRSRKNADGDDMVDDYQYDYYQDPAAMMQMQNPMLMGMYQNPMMYQQQPPYPGDQGQQQQQQHYPPQYDPQMGGQPGEPQQQQQHHQQPSGGEPQQREGENQYAPQPPQMDPMQVQMQMQYQQMMMQQMYMHANSTPVIEEVLADGTVVQYSHSDEPQRARRGNRR